MTQNLMTEVKARADLVSKLSRGKAGQVHDTIIGLERRVWVLERSLYNANEGLRFHV